MWTPRGINCRDEPERTASVPPYDTSSQTKLDQSAPHSLRSLRSRQGYAPPIIFHLRFVVVLYYNPEHTMNYVLCPITLLTSAGTQCLTGSES